MDNKYYAVFIKEQPREADEFYILNAKGARMIASLHFTNRSIYGKYFAGVVISNENTLVNTSFSKHDSIAFIDLENFVSVKDCLRVVELKEFL